MISALKEQFRKHYRSEAQYLFFCPGRVNLIGEHIDYNGGRVMPCAISLGTWLAVAKNLDKQLRFRSVDFKETADFHLQASYTKTGKEWFNYPLGVINHFAEQEVSLSGLNMMFAGNLPIGAGLSSSASIEVLTAFAVSEMFALGLQKQELALIGKKVENEFIGVSCGIMDQFAVAMGNKDHAILLDCDTLDHSFIPFDAGEFELVIINTNKPRALAESKYNERFLQCGQALKMLKQEIDVDHLCQVSSAQFEKSKSLITDPVLLKRARHVITENERVNRSATYLAAGNRNEFGKLLFASHDSLQNDYEVSGKELDSIVDFCKRYEGCAGARMTGAGFGGCAIALIEKPSINDFSKKLMQDYKGAIGYEPSIFVSEIGDGVRRIA